MSDSGADGPVLGIAGIDSAVEISRSASHTTYRVHDTATDRTFVVKVLSAGRDRPGLAERFEREQLTMAALAHPNIVPVLGHGWSDIGVPFIVNGEVAGESIIDRLRGSAPITAPDILSMCIQLAGALESAHRADVVHGDVRPEGMVITAEGQLLLADFGIATLVRPNAADVTDPADLAHVAPELLDGRPATASSDLYSLTSALFTLFTGLTAYVRPGDQSVTAVMNRIASDPLPEMPARNVPGPLVDVISTGMAKDPAERYPSAQVLGQSLQQAQMALGLPMTEMTIVAPKERSAPVRRAAAAAAVAEETAAPTEETAPEAEASPAEDTREPEDTLPPAVSTAEPMWDAVPPNRTPVVIAVAAIVAVVVIAVAAFLATRSADEDTAGSTTTATTAQASTSTTTNTTGTTGTTPPVSAPSVRLTSDGGQLVVDVLPSWSEHSTADTADALPELQASPSLTEFAGTTFLQPGIDYVVYPADYLDPSDLGAVLDHILAIDRGGQTLDALCTRGTRTDFTPNGDGLAAGLFERLTTCNGGGDVIAIAATDAARSFTAVIEVHVGRPPDDAGVDLATSTFDVLHFP